ncbi:MAG: hypothetical protein ACOYL5_06790, partial [Phototrophicaceae bacterium]
IQQLQFTDRSAAEALLVGFIQDTFDLAVIGVELRPLAVSLNSFNGFLTLADGRSLFFKTHTEADNVIGEYYRAGQLADVGYPVIRPLYSSTDAGKHLLIYERIQSPSVFDVAWQIENGDDNQLAALIQAQQATDDRLFELYQATLAEQSAADNAQAAIHQLFYHRLTGGRLDRFYGEGTQLKLPTGLEMPMSLIRDATWTINGQAYTETLEQIIRRAIGVLNPAQAGWSVVGHGDAHNGNVFLTDHDGTPSLLYFDPAFAGRHSPLLDLVKPIFHNVFAMWMYFPKEIHQRVSLSLQVAADNRWAIQHDFSLHPVRQMFLNSKVQRVLIPTVVQLKAQHGLPNHWREILKLGLFCCPFLTMNLADGGRFVPEIALLGLSMAVEMGSESVGERSLIDRVLDDVERQLGLL